MKYICSLIVVENIIRSRYFYEKILCQSVKTDFGENVTFHGDFAIHQKSHYKDLINENPISSKSNNFELYFETEELETIVSQLKEMEIEFIHEILEQPWRQKVVRFYDYDFNIIEIGERMEHVAFRLYLEKMSIEEISKITYLPEELVKQAIENYNKG